MRGQAQASQAQILRHVQDFPQGGRVDDHRQGREGSPARHAARFHGLSLQEGEFHRRKEFRRNGIG